MSRTYRWPAVLWFAAVALAAVQLVLVVTSDPSLPLSIAIGALFLTAATLTALQARRAHP